MSREQGATLLRHVRGLIDAVAIKEQTDAELLEQFAARREEAAFTVLLKRHARLVWGVCRNVLWSEQDAEDVFQATFLLLARQASTIRDKSAVSSWLHGVAYRLALKARTSSLRREVRERIAPGRRGASGVDIPEWREIRALIDEAVQSLPVKIRTPFVLCVLEGETRAEAARELRCREGTISSRIARARRMLQQRLVRRGITLSATLSVGRFSEQAMAGAVPRTLIFATLKAVAVHGTNDQAVSSAVSALAREVPRVVTRTTWQAGAVSLLASISTAPHWPNVFGLETQDSQVFRAEPFVIYGTDPALITLLHGRHTKVSGHGSRDSVLGLCRVFCQLLAFFSFYCSAA